MSLFVLSSPAAWLLWFILLTVAMYFARLPAHRAILSLARAIHHAMRLATHSLRLAEQKLAARNREVLLAAGREAKERIIEREFERIDASVRRDLAERPTLHRRLTEQATKLEEDHDQSKAIPAHPARTGQGGQGGCRDRRQGRSDGRGGAPHLLRTCGAYGTIVFVEAQAAIVERQATVFEQASYLIFRVVDHRFVDHTMNAPGKHDIEMRHQLHVVAVVTTDVIEVVREMRRPRAKCCLNPEKQQPSGWRRASMIFAFGRIR